MKNVFMYMIGTVVLLSSTNCRPQKDVASSEVPPYAVSSLPKVDISTFPKNAEGAFVLFDGTSLNGWRGYNKESVPAKWGIEDGLLKFSSAGAGLGKEDGGDLIFAYDFKNFELEFECKISHAGNSGVFFLAKEIKDQPNKKPRTNEQPLDTECDTDAKLGVDGTRKPSSLYAMMPAKPQNSKTVGEWNKAKNIVNDGKVTHYQNGEKVVEYTLWTPDWTALLQAGKFSKEK